MATNTPNYNFVKPNEEEFYDIKVSNSNLDKIDHAIKTIDDKVTNFDTSGLATKEEVKTVSDDLTSHKKENATEHQRLAIEDLRLLNLNNNLQREVAYLKLKQEANERVDGGTTFADDMNSNRFGITFDEVNSQNIVIRDGSMLMLKNEITEHNADGITVINQPYDISRNGNRKLVRLSNGWLVVALDAGSDIYLYKSTDNGLTWEKLKETGSSAANASITSYGNNVCILTTNGSGSGLNVYARVINVVTDTVVGAVNTVLDTNQTFINSSTLTVNEAGTELHAAWSSKNSTYINSFNIRYVKGTINADGSITWGSVEQVTNYNSTGGDRENPTIIATKNSVSIMTQLNYSGTKAILYLTKEYTTKNFDPSYTNENWGSTIVHSGATYIQSCASAIFVPQSINGLVNGRIWVTWHGLDSTSQGKYNIFVAYSDDNGMNWTLKKLTNDTVTNNDFPSITADRNGKVYIVYQRPYSINMFTWYNNVWDSGQLIRGGTGADVKMYPSTLVDFSIPSITTPLVIYGQFSSGYIVSFSGKWTSIGEVQTTTATAIYDLPSTDYVGAFVKKEGNVNIDAYINDVVMDKSLENDEYMFTKDLPSEAPIKLRLELSRDNISGGSNDKVTRILGGRA